MKEMPLLWLDLETTGLDTDHCQILQLGLALTNPALEPLARLEIDINHKTYFHFDAFARQMHTDSGLLAKCEASEITEDEARDTVKCFLRGANAEQFLLAGNSLHFDRAVLQSQGWYTTILQLCHYRHLDVSFFKAMYMSQGWELLPENKAHTALADIDNSIATLRRYMDDLDVDGAPSGWAK